VLCGANDWEEIEEFGEARREWFGGFLQLPNGIPSHDTFNRVFSLLDAGALQECFIKWVQSIAAVQDGQVVAIDGKRLCNAGEGGKKSIVHMVSAFCNDGNVVLGQLKVTDKSNEITAMPELLKALYLKGSIVTIDAMGCQQGIAEAIINKEADYILAVKGNQGFLEDDIKEAFKNSPAASQHTQSCVSHGRIEKRTCKVITDTSWVCNAAGWKGLSALVMVEAGRIEKNTGQTERQSRFYIASIKGDAKKLNAAIRGHWGIENKLHWALDVTFGEDKSRKRAGNAAQNFSTITKIVLNILKKRDDSRGAKKLSIKTKRFKCNISLEYLTDVLKNL
jgi:predicted transposase YbfD/YdcC